MISLILGAALLAADCERAQATVRRYLALDDFKKAEAEHLIYAVDREGGTDYAEVVSPPVVTGCETKGAELAVLVTATVFAETSWGGRDGQFPKLENVAAKPAPAVRRMRMHRVADAWAIDLWDTDPPYRTLAATVADYAGRLALCPRDAKERELCAQSVGADLATLRAFAAKP